MATRVLKPVALDETVQEVVEKLNGIKDVLDTKTFTPSVLLDNKSITENGVYEAVLDDDTPCDGYAKVTVNVAGGGVDFENVMLQNVAPALVPTSWEIPVDVTEIPDDYSGRDDLLSQMERLTTVTLADGHPGLTRIGTSAFAGFTNLATFDAEIPGGTIEYGVFARTKIIAPVFTKPVTFLHAQCFAALQVNSPSNVFTSEQITNEEYKVHEWLHQYSFGGAESEDVYTKKEHEHIYVDPISGASGYAFSENQPLYNSDFTPYPEDGRMKMKHVEDSDGSWYVITHDDSVDLITYMGKQGPFDDYDGEQFGYNNTITGYNLPNLVKISYSMFSGNSQIVNFAFDKATKVAYGAFSGCSSMQKLSLKRCEYFNFSALENCLAITEIDFSLAPFVVETEYVEMFPEVENPVIVKVPSSLLADFTADYNWSQLMVADTYHRYEGADHLNEVFKVFTVNAPDYTNMGMGWEVGFITKPTLLNEDGTTYTEDLFYFVEDTSMGETVWLLKCGDSGYYDYYPKKNAKVTLQGV